MEKIQGGKKSLKTMFKSQQSTDVYYQALDKQHQEQTDLVIAQEKINACVDKHLITKVVPDF